MSHRFSVVSFHGNVANLNISFDNKSRFGNFAHHHINITPHGNLQSLSKAFR
jgi:hypothetical protein